MAIADISNHSNVARTEVAESERFGNPEMIRENQAIRGEFRVNLRIDSRELGHLRV